MDNAGSSTREKEAVLGVFAAVLRPLIRLAFEYGISAKEISDAARRAYIQALELRLAASSRPLTDARIAVLAELARSEVSALRDNGRGNAAGKNSSARLDQVASLLSVWHTHPKFSGAYGLALDLDLEPTPGSPRRSLSELIEVACPKAAQESLLDELVAGGSAEIVDGSTLRARSRAHVMRGSEVTVTRIERAARFLEAAAASFAHNLLLQDSSAYFERTLVSDYPLSERGRDEFLRLTTEKGEEFILDLDTALAKIVDPERSLQGKRYGVGIYFFQEQAASGEAPSQNRRANTEVRSNSHQVREEIDVLAPPRRTS
jgi:hypothetical protein